MDPLAEQMGIKFEASLPVQKGEQGMSGVLMG